MLSRALRLRCNRNKCSQCLEPEAYRRRSLRPLRPYRESLFPGGHAAPQLRAVRHSQGLAKPAVPHCPSPRFQEHSQFRRDASARDYRQKTAARESCPFSHKARPRPAEHESCALKWTADRNQCPSLGQESWKPPAPHQCESKHQLRRRFFQFLVPAEARRFRCWPS